MPGGLAKTVEDDGYRFDLGGHRFFTKAPEVAQLWQETRAKSPRSISTYGANRGSRTRTGTASQS